MIKTLKITGILAAFAAIGCVVMLALFGLKEDPTIEKILNAPSVVDIFKKQATKTKTALDQVSPLVKWAKTFALRINPPAPKIPKPTPKKTVARQQTPKKPIPKPKVQVNAKFNLVATCRYEDQPEKSMALLDMPAKGLEWFRIGDEVNHLIIHQINDGSIDLYKDGNKNSSLTMPVIKKKSLLKEENNVPSAPPQATPDEAAAEALLAKILAGNKNLPNDAAQNPANANTTPKKPATTRITTPKKPAVTQISAPKEPSPEQKKQSLEKSISNIKRIMARSKASKQGEGKEMNEVWSKLLQDLEKEKQDIKQTK